MRKRSWKYRWGLWGFTALLISIPVLLSLMSLFRLSEQLERQSMQKGQDLTESLAKGAFLAAYVGGKQGPLNESLLYLVESAVGGEVIYAQIIKDGQVLAERKAIDLAIPVEGTSAGLQITKKLLPDGTPYLDFKRSLLGKLTPMKSETVDNYVRLGLSLANSQREVQRETLISWAVGLGFALLGLTVMLLLDRLILQPVETLSRTVESFSQAWGRQPESERTQMVSVLGPSTLMRVSNLIIDDSCKEVRVGEKIVKLAPKEYDLLRLFVSEPGKVFSDEEIIRKIWPEGGLASASDVKRYIHLLRNKIEEDPKRAKLIITVRGFGYKLSG